MYTHTHTYIHIYIYIYAFKTIGDDFGGRSARGRALGDCAALEAVAQATTLTPSSHNKNSATQDLFQELGCPGTLFVDR